MSIAVIASLVGLALVDSTSVGTLVLPILMMVHPRLRASRLLVYLATIAGFYWLLGLAVLAGVDVITQLGSAEWRDGRAVLWVQAALGLALLVGSFWPDTPWAKRRAAAREERGEPIRLQRWRDRVVGPNSSLGVVMAVALAAGVVEAASMFPYLGAVGLITTSGVSYALGAVILAAYCVVMCLPALVLLGVRVVAADWLAPRLAPLADWLQRRTGGAVWWIIGILGFLVLADAVQRIGFLG